MGALGAAALEALDDQLAGLVHQLLALAHIHKAAADQVRPGQQLAVGGDGGHHDDQTVLGEVAAVPQDHVAHVAHAQAVHHHRAGRHRLAGLQRVGGQADVLADLGDVDVLGRDAQALGGHGVLFQLLVLAVHRQKELGRGEGENELLLLLAGVAGNMHVVHGFIDDLRAQQKQAVHHLGDHLLIAGDGGGGDDDEVPRAHMHVAVAGRGHAGERAQRLALAAGGDEHDLLRRILVQLLDVDEHPFGSVQVSQLQGHLGVVGHAAAAHCHLAAVLHRQVDDLLDAVEVGGEGGDDDALFVRPAEQVRKALGHLLLGGGEAGALGVGGIAQQRQHALGAVLREGGQVGGPAGEGGVVHLEVAGLDDDARRALDGEGHRVGDGVVHMDGVDGKAAQLELAPGGDLHQLGAAQQAVLFQLVLDEADGEPGGIHRQVHLLEQVGQRADVVLVAVGDDDALDLVFILRHIGEVGDDQVHAEHVAVREDEAAVHHEHVALALVQGDVLAHFAKAAQRDDVHGGGGGAVLLLLLGPAGAAVKRLAAGIVRRAVLGGLGRLGGGLCLAVLARFGL